MTNMRLRKSDRVFVAGHRGLVGSALCRALLSRGHEVITTSIDFRDNEEVKRFYAETQPDVAFIAAAKVGGILANSTRGADFLHQNLTIQNNLIWGAHEANVRRLVFLGSSCIYPRDAEQPIRETALMTGPLEPTNRPYAIAKIAGLELVASLRRQYGRDYFSVMPTNLYGPNDKYDEQSAHVIPALIAKMTRAKREGAPFVTVWGTGTPMREFMHSDDCADAILTLAERVEVPNPNHINVGTGEEISIADLARLIAEAVGYEGELRFDSSLPDGTPRKLLDRSAVLLALGWEPKHALRDALFSVIATLRN